MKWKSHCIQVRNSRIIALKDGNCKSQLRIQNDSNLKISIVRVDGCEILSGRRCDYLFYSTDLKSAFFVELKGADFEHGISQIETTLSQYKNKFKEYTVTCYVICSQFPRAITAKQKFQKIFMKRHGKLLRVEKNPYVLVI